MHDESTRRRAAAELLAEKVRQNLRPPMKVTRPTKHMFERSIEELLIQQRGGLTS